MGAGVSAMIEERVLISGIGSSVIGRRLHRDPWSLTVEAALLAVEDAGLSVDEIDGLSTYPGAIGSTPGITGAGVDDVRSLLGLKLRWHTGGMEVPGQLGSVANAVLAVGSGLANHVLCFRTVWESSAQDQRGGRSEVMRGGLARESKQWTDPYGAGYPTYGGLMMQRYLYESGATRKQIAQIAVVARAHAAHNPSAAYREPLSVDEYLESRMISDPLCLYDCDVPIDGSIAVVISRSDSDAIVHDRAVKIHALGTASGFEECAEMMWARTTLTPSDVDVAELYDGFSILAVRWLEALGLCPRNGTGQFIEGGHRISLGGDLPLNTGGGQLSGGRMHGYGALLEACQQLRGVAESRQVNPWPGVVCVSSGSETFTSCLLLGAPQ
jgi:acetyl-CoA acetyltransferase